MALKDKLKVQTGCYQCWGYSAKHQEQQLWDNWTKAFCFNTPPLLPVYWYWAILFLLKAIPISVRYTVTNSLLQMLYLLQQ